MPRFRHRPLVLLTLLAVPAGAMAATPEPPPGSPPQRAQVDENPCLAATRQIRCPDLEMKRPFGLSLEKRAGKRLLRAGNSIDNVGTGPAELTGRRVSNRYMRARQRIYITGGPDLRLRTGARLRFAYGHVRRHYWKFHNAAKFELWRLTKRGKRKRLVRKGAKISYCLRDLRRTRDGLRRSPRRAVYPACSTDPFRRRVTLGTSVGWSDIYPPGYVKQYINVSGLRGCFAFVHIADPYNHIYELDEDNNESQVIVRLPWRGPGKHGCKGRARGKVNRETGPY